LYIESVVVFALYPYQQTLESKLW